MDDGTVGKYGAEVRLRRELEKTINQQRIHASKGIYTFVIIEVILGCVNFEKECSKKRVFSKCSFPYITE